MLKRFSRFIAVQVVASLGLLCLCGCITEGTEPKKIKKLPPPPEDARIEQLHLWSLPVGLNLDGKPGADGFSIKIYASSPDYPKPIAFNKGELEILMYDGAGTDAEDQPLKIWKFGPEDLKPFAAITPIGVSYEIVLPWGASFPTKKNISILARYFPPGGGNAVITAPTSINVAEKGPKPVL
ncbi:MAG: hypothetical protein ACO1QB_02830 [Verrucomicrobiales bacterium]